MVKCWAKVNDFYLFKVWKWTKQGQYFVKTYTYLDHGHKIITRSLFRVKKIEHYGQVKIFILEEINY